MIVREKEPLFLFQRIKYCSAGVSETTVSRELRRNATMNGKYVWDKADVLSRSRMHRAPGNRAVSQSLAWRVKELITGEQCLPNRYLATWQR